MNLQKELNKNEFVHQLVDVLINGKSIVKIEFYNNELGKLILTDLREDKINALYDFYFNGLSEQSQYQFPPYPLFKPIVTSPAELLNRYREWRKEKDWYLFIIENQSEIIGVCVLKKLDWKDDPGSPNRPPTSGLAVREKFKRKGIGLFLQEIVELQAKLYGCKRLFVTIKQDNAPSIQMHKKAGFTETGKIIPQYKELNGERIFDNNDIELVIDLFKQLK